MDDASAWVEKSVAVYGHCISLSVLSVDVK